MSELIVDNLDLYCGEFHALKSIHLEIPTSEITAFIGPPGCGRSTLLKSPNRMGDLVKNCCITGKALSDGEDIYCDLGISKLRKKIGMVFQKPDPFPMNIYDNIAFGPRTRGICAKAELDETIECSLKRATIWDKVKDELGKSTMGLSGGQQQRLCIARALAIKPDVLLMDEPTNTLDPTPTSKIEDLVIELRKKYNIVMVIHSIQQAVKISDKVAFFLMGEVVEFNKTSQLFPLPQDERIGNYITERFG